MTTLTVLHTDDALELNVTVKCTLTVERGDGIVRLIANETADGYDHTEAVIEGEPERIAAVGRGLIAAAEQIDSEAAEQPDSGIEPKAEEPDE